MTPALLLLPPTLALLVGGLTYRRLRRSHRQKTDVLPYLPAMSERVEGQQNETTRFLAAVHEMTMAVTNAWNTTRSRRAGATVESVVQLDALLPACDAVVENAAAMTARFSQEAALTTRAQERIDALDAIWEVTTSRDDLFNKDRPRYKHTFRFHPEAVAPAQQAILALLETVPPKPHLPNVHRLEVRTDRMAPAERLFLERLVNDTVLAPQNTRSITDTDVLANQWILGACVDTWLLNAHDNTRFLRDAHGGAFDVIRRSSSDEQKSALRLTKQGPDGYKEAERLKQYLQGIADGWLQTERMLRICTFSATELARFAQDPGKIESNKLYLERAVNAYRAAFPLSTFRIRTGTGDALSVVGGLLAALVALLASGAVLLAVAT